MPPYRDYDREPDIVARTFGILFVFLFMFLIIYVIYCTFNWYYASIDYMEKQTFQNSRMNDSLEEIALSLKALTKECN